MPTLQERFQALMPLYYRGAKGVMIVYDITDKYTFKKAKNWVSEARKKAPTDIQGKDSLHFVWCSPDVNPMFPRCNIFMVFPRC